MTIRHKNMISDRLYKINEIVNFAKTDPEKAAAILNDYRVEQIYEDVERICGYLPDSILDAIVEQIEGSANNENQSNRNRMHR